MNAMELIKEVTTYIQNNGGVYFEWYVGIASDPRQRLFVEHGVKEIGDVWIFSTADNASMARAAEKHLLDVLRADGGPGGGDNTTTVVYAYKKAWHTKERN